jgi:hypothetical protein
MNYLPSKAVCRSIVARISLCGFLTACRTLSTAERLLNSDNMVMEKDEKKTQKCDTKGEKNKNFYAKFYSW